VTFFRFKLRRQPSRVEVNGMKDDLRALRTLAAVSQFTLARRSGIPRVRISLFESGQLELGFEERARIHAALLKIIEAKSLQLQSVLANSRTEAGGISV
jgi:transcriptional regulator with XRE-family HTH domain